MRRARESNGVRHGRGGSCGPFGAAGVPEPGLRAQGKSAGRHRTAFIVVLLACLLALPALAQDTERFLLYRVERIEPEQAPTIDGVLDEPAWQERPGLTSLRNFLGPLTGDLPTQRSEFVLMTDGPMLYIGATFHDEKMSAIAANPAAAPYWNDCTELYFDPQHDGRMSIQLTVDCLGQRFWQRRINEGAGWWDDAAWYILAQWQVAVHRGKTEWTIELAIDASSFDIDTTPGAVCGFNACRFRLGAENQEFSAWGFEGGQRQKNIDAWGHLLFLAPGEDSGGAITRAEVETVYGDLGDRRIRVPVEGAFEVFTSDGHERVSFRELLQEAAGAVREQLAALRTAMEALPAGDRRAEVLQAQFPTLQERARELLAAAEAQDLTLGVHDRLSDDLEKVRLDLHELTWQARLLALAVDARKGAPQ